MHYYRQAAGNTLGFRRKYLAYYREWHGSETDRKDNVEESEAGQWQPAKSTHVISSILELEVITQDAQTNGHHCAGYYQQRLPTKSEERRDEITTILLLHLILRYLEKFVRCFHSFLKFEV